MQLNEFVLSQFPVLPSVEMPQTLSAGTAEARATGVRPPERLLRFQLAAELAFARAEQEKYGFTERKWWKAVCRIFTLERRLERYCSFRQIPDQMEPSFHSAALERALLVGDTQRARQHAARLQELIPGRSSREFVEDTRQWLREGAAPEGILGYARRHFVLFRRRRGELRLTIQPMDDKAAHDLLASLRLGTASWDDLSTASRTCVYPEVSLRNGDKAWIELSLEGFWVMVCCSGRRFGFATPFPRFEEAALFLRGTLSTDLENGLWPTRGWASDS